MGRLTWRNTLAIQNAPTAKPSGGEEHLHPGQREHDRARNAERIGGKQGPNRCPPVPGVHASVSQLSCADGQRQGTAAHDAEQADRVDPSQIREAEADTMPTSISSGVTRCSRVRIDSPQRTIRLHRENRIQSTQARSIWTT